MTDQLPRRAYPLVVPPPGGFEDAVRRGRGMRRRKAGSSSAAVLAVVGALTYSMLSSKPDTSGLDATRTPPPTHQPGPPVIGLPSPEPSASPPGDRPSNGPTTVATGPVTGPVAGPSGPAQAPGSPRPTASHPQPDPQPTYSYARRSPIAESGSEVNTSTASCLQPESSVRWCATVRADEAESGTSWVLGYLLCRAIGADEGVVAFDRVQEVEFWVEEVSSGERIWTYSAGQPFSPASTSTRVDSGYCVEWTTTWNGYDDFMFTPTPGSYRLHADSTGRSDAPLPADSDDFEIGGESSARDVRNGEEERD